MKREYNDNAGENVEEDNHNGHQIKTSSIPETLRMVESAAWKNGGGMAKLCKIMEIFFSRTPLRIGVHLFGQYWFPSRQILSP